MKNPFRYFNSSPEIIRLTVMMYEAAPPLRAPPQTAQQPHDEICPTLYPLPSATPPL